MWRRYASFCAARQFVAVFTVGDATHAASLFFDIIRQKRQPLIGCRWRGGLFLLALSWSGSSFRRLARTRHAACSLPHEELTMTLMTSTFFYDRKIRIAILTLATFAALC